jgi:starch synthase
MLAVIDATSKENLDILTIHRMPGALPFAGKFRLIDFALSNFRNSNITNVAIFPYGNYRSLQDHIGSGKRWDLDRHKDGLFILPPKNLSILPGEAISFQRMYEHIEYFKRSKQEYVIVTTPNIVWNIDFNDVLKQHEETNADITEIIYENIRLKTFVLSKKLLMEYIMDYDTLQYRNMIDLVSKAPNLQIYIYRHKSYTRTITDPFNYLKSNLDMLLFDNGKMIFQEERPIFSKEKAAPPAMYQKDAHIVNSMVSSGSIINGSVINSIVGRDVIVKKGAIIKNSFVMSSCLIEDNAKIEYAILDKQTIVKENTLITGTLRNPYLTQKEQLIRSQKTQHILFAASESYPFIKTGGLADVIGSLSRNLVRNGIDVTVVLPLYKKIKDTFGLSLKREEGFKISYGDEQYFIRKYTHTYKKVKYIFIESHDFFDVDQIYSADKKDADRFAFFSLSVVKTLDTLLKFDLIHIHDWHTALIPLLLDNSPHKGLKTLLTIHNIDYQGVASKGIIKKLGIENFIFRDETINFLEIGLNTATKLSTVSPTYKEELKYEYYGKNLTYVIQKREREFYGILNGISSSLDPEIDKLIYVNYDVNSIHLKQSNKTFLQSKMGLNKNENTLIIGMVTRIVEQKGFDLIIQALPSLLNSLDIQFILLGSGDDRYIKELQKIEKQYPDKVCLNIGYDAAIPNHIYAGSDVFLMPSRFEPCGLGQMIALKYGTLPVVRNTGGLADTVDNYDPITGKGNGFKFFNFDANEMKNVLLEVYDLFKHNKDTWNKLITRAMKTDYSLKKTALRYIELYRAIIEN